MSSDKFKNLIKIPHRDGLKKPLAVILLVALLAALGYGAYLMYGGEEKTIEASGTIEATTINITAKAAGTIQNFQIKSGQQVQQGQLLATLSRNDLLAQKERDELSVVKAETALADLMSGARAQEFKEAQANVNIARANYQRSDDDYERMKALFAGGAISKVDFEKAKTAVEISSNQLAVAEARASLLAEGNRAEQVKAAEIEVARNKAVLKATEALVTDLQVTAPLTGTVLTKSYEEGEFLQQGATLLTIARIDDLWVKVYIPTDDLPYITLGQNVQFSVSGYNQSFEGVVEEIASKGEFTPKTIQTKKERTNVVFAVKIRIKSEGGILKPGMPADVVFQRGVTND